LVAGINSGFREQDAWLTADELTAIFASDRTDLGGPGGYDLYRATRTARTADFGAPTLMASLNSAQTDRKPVLSPDGLTLFFSSSRPLADGATTSNNIYVATRPNALSDFGAPGTLAGANSSASDLVNSITADGKVLYLDSGSGSSRDIYTRELASSAAPVAVSGVNSADDEGFGVISADSLTLYFGSNRPVPNQPDAGIMDPWNIWVAHRTSPTGTFGTPSPVAELNTLSLDIPSWMSADGCTIYLTSDRNAPSGTRHIWVATRPQ